jgi:SAM-dependent methyltransferase
MTRQFAVSTVTTGSDTRGIGHDNTGRTRTDRGQAARSSELGSGDFPAVAKLQLWVVGERLVRRVGIGRDENVLDIACGTGNAALRAAAAGGRVVGVDLTPELFIAGRALAAEAGIEIPWVEGDAEELPFEDERFDVVLSTFGVMFAPRHQVAARELVRVLRPGGRFGFTSWTPEGIQGAFFQTMGEYAPPAPPFVHPPLCGAPRTVSGTSSRAPGSRSSSPASRSRRRRSTRPARRWTGMRRGSVRC